MTGILKEFIESRIQKYTPPAREGTPKGEPIGFSREKYAASLWALTSLNQKEVAKLAGCKYETLRVWRSTEDFKAKVLAHAEELCTIIVNASESSMHSVVAGNYEQFVVEATLRDPAGTTAKILGDVNLYADFVKITLANTIVKKYEPLQKRCLEDPENFTLSNFFIAARNLFTWLIPGINNKQDLTEIVALYEETKRQLILPHLLGFLNKKVYPILNATDPNVAKALSRLIGLIHLIEEE
jgi:hypothetical protein